MRRDTLNFIVDVLALLAVLVLIATGALLTWVVPPGSRGGAGLSFWGLGRHDWGDIHFWVAVALVALMVLHVALHWTWVCLIVTRGLRGGGTPPATSRNVVGAVFLLVLAALLVGFSWYAYTHRAHTDEGAGYHGGRRAERPGDGIVMAGRSRGTDVHIAGSQTLREIAAAAGVTPEALCRALGLPGNVSADERLGRLRQQYGFEMEAVREALAALSAGGGRGRESDRE